MCGIVGVRRFDGKPVAESLLRDMSGLLAHRGPDGEGHWAAGSVGFGHRRLSIIDPTGSPQPMASVDRHCHLAFNGEIFNYRELRDATDYPFHTNGDTEVLLALFHLDAAGAPARLQGQFAYAAHDRRDDTLWLVRDRLGILPLYYYLDDSMLAFASEIKALVPALPAPLSVDELSLGDYLAQRSVPAPYTLFRGIHKLPQGHHLRVSADGTVSLRRYWSIPGFGDAPVEEATAVGALGGALQESVRACLVADVPVGAYLSGGVDSSLIVAITSALREGEPVETFSAGFGDPRHDELPFAREVSELFGTHHHEVRVTANDFESLWRRLTWHRDAPVSEPADVAVFKLASLARRHVKVVLSGEGSDELFAGYPKYRFARLASAVDVVPPSLRPPLFGILERLLPGRAGQLRVAVRAMAAPDADERMQEWFAPFTRHERVRLLGGPQRYGQPDVLAAAEGDVVRRMLHLDCHGWLADNLLERGDRMSMAASLELRPPFLDHRVVELAFRLPTSVKIRDGRAKWVVKEVARRYLPDRIVDRRKVGFRVPLDDWFRGHLREMSSDLLLSPGSFVGGLLDRTAIRGLLDSHQSGRRNEEIRLWTLLCLEVWHEVFLRGDRGRP
ncbi:MAG: asparagine synthase (glutamine-hydrolyzing) [Acidimicrobiales bacterium]